jgi:hypothetical protein
VEFSDGSWSQVYRDARGEQKEALELLFRCNIISTDEFAFSKVDQDHIQESLWIATHMLRQKPLEEWVALWMQAQQTFEDHVTACFEARGGPHLNLSDESNTKDSFTGLRDAIPTMRGGDKSSRAQILKKASEYIQYMRRKNSLNHTDLEDLKRQNSHLEAQIRALERAKGAGNFSSAAEILNEQGLLDEGETIPTANDLGSTKIAPGQSLLLSSPDNVNGSDPPRRKTKLV